MVLLDCSPLLATTGIVLSGCAVASSSESGMMGSGSNAFSSTLVCKIPKNFSGKIVKVILTDMGMSMMADGIAQLGAQMCLTVSPRKVSTGVISILVENLGWRAHELVILSLVKGQKVGQRKAGSDGKVSESGSVGEASNNCGAGVGDGVKSGSATWTTISLKPGRYELVCNLANHYADGMYQELDVV